jgi:ubiquinone/menaquinone biosynthesis C-methylase UbiE
LIHGSCLCGAVAFEIEGRVSPMQTCHCSRCGKVSGSAFSTSLLTAGKSFRWLRGAEAISVFRLPSGFAHSFCRSCGSPVPVPYPDGKVVGLPAGSLEGDPGTRLLRHTFVGSKAPWFEITDDVPQFESWAAEPVSGDPKQIVAAGYDAIGAAYDAQRAEQPGPELVRLIEQLPRGARVLDIGCRGGRPVTLALAQRADVVGVDLSAAQIERARRAVPNARFVVGDIMAQQFAAGSFDAVVAFYALFHLPREEQGPLLERVAGWLAPGGLLLATVPAQAHAGYTEPDFFGARMYWSQFESNWYADRLHELGFEILTSGILSHGYRDAPERREERHPYLFARRR